MGVNYIVIGFDMEVQPLVTNNATWPLCRERCSNKCRVQSYAVSTNDVSAIGIAKNTHKKKNRNGPIQMTQIDKSICQKWVMAEQIQ